MKDGSKLFEVVDDGVYDRAMEKLLEMRMAHPDYYRDDQLLMFLLCQQLAGVQEQEDIELMVACAKCGSQPGNRCKSSKGGWNDRVHVARVHRLLQGGMYFFKDGKYSKNLGPRS